jgi:hypothetical protein
MSEVFSIGSDDVMASGPILDWIRSRDGLWPRAALHKTHTTTRSALP